MRVQAAAKLHVHGAGREVHLVMHHEHFLRGRLLLTQQLGERAAARVHVVLRLGKQHLARALRRPHGAARHHAARLALPIARAVALCKRVDRGEARVVARACVLGPGVSQPADDADVLWSCLLGHGSSV